MAMNSTSAPENISEDEGDLSEQFKSTLDELGRVTLKYKALKEVNKDLVRERQSFEETISNFELQLEVSRRDEDRLLKPLLQIAPIYRAIADISPKYQVADILGKYRPK